MDPRSVPSRKGAPVVALALVLAGWLGIRVTVWQSPFPDVLAMPAPPVDEPPNPSLRVPMAQISTPHPDALRNRVSLSVGRREIAQLRQLPQVSAAAPSPRATGSLTIATSVPAIAAGLAPAATGQQPGAPSAVIALPSLPARPHVGGARRRWHLDAWAAWRGRADTQVVAPGASPIPSYGASQAGLLARFDMDSGNHPPALHVRVAHAPDRPRQSDFAAGASVRPVAGIPVRVYGELRATRAFGSTRVRPVVFAVSELPPVALPAGLKGEGYLQAGWSGGRYATGFVDGQARVGRAIGTGETGVFLGVGAWGGAQKFAGRLDLGPTVALDLRSGGIPARIALDYRVRVAGTASPDSGPAITLSTGF